MARTTDEWIGKTDNSVPPVRVRVRVFEAYGGRCYLSGRLIRPGDKWDLDHIRAIINGGANRENNLAPALKDAHRVKTQDDLAEKSKTARIRAKHLGQWEKPKGNNRLQSRPFQKPRPFTEGERR